MAISATDERAVQLNGYDKLYLLMSKWKLIRLFNPLCFAASVTCIEDLESNVKTNLEGLKNKLPSWSQSSSTFSHDLEIIETMIEDSKTVNFEDLPHLLGIQKNTYKEELEAGGVQIIPKDHVSLQSKIALGRPFSGDVYNAQWTRQDNSKVDVVLRYDFGPTQRDSFIREAKIMTGLHHQYIMKFYGAVVLGSYAHSVGLVVERFSLGNLEEFPVPSLFHAWLYALQLSSALDYLETKNLVHTSVVEPFVYISSDQKIKLGGFMCCYYKEETDRARVSGYHRDLLLSAVTGHQGRRLDDLSIKGVVAMFSHVVISMFRYLDSHRSRTLSDVYPGEKKWPLVCPSGIASLMERCVSLDVENRPNFEEIVQALAKMSQTKAVVWPISTLHLTHRQPKPQRSPYIYDLFINNILQWANNYHCLMLIPFLKGIKLLPYPVGQTVRTLLLEEKPVTCCFTMSNSSADPCELSYEKGEKVWVISQDTTRYHGMWFGQKENRATGFFKCEKAVKIDDDDQVPLEVRARGIEAELAYRGAVLEGKVKICRARLLIIGQDRAGKTSLKKSLIGLPFNPDEPSTEVLEVNSSKFEFTVEQVVEWKAVNNDGVEQPRPEDRSIARLVAENMLKKKADEKQMLPVEEKMMTEDKPATDSTHLNGAPRPLVNQSVTSAPTQDSDTFSENLVDGYQEEPSKKPDITMPKELTSLVTECLRNQDNQSDGNIDRETVLDIWDFAGQHLYYATHPIFFSHKAVYLLVHNLSKNLHELAEPSFKHGEHSMPLKNTSHETNLDMLLSWLVSVHSICQPSVDRGFLNACKSTLRCLPPPVLLVGTHADKVSSQDIGEVESMISSSLKGKAFQEHVLVPFYKVDNTKSSNSPGVKAIQARVQEILSSGLNSTADLPVKWFHFEKALKRLAIEKVFLTLDEIHDVARRECFIDDDKQLDAMLNYYHDLGLIVRFKDTVVLDTQWLVNLFKKLITIRPFQEQDPVDRKLWEELEETGVLHMQLIDKVFENNLCGNGSASLKQSVLDMMETCGFVARFHPYKESDAQSSDSCSAEIKYFVPAQLAVSVADLWSLTPQDGDPCPLVFTFCGGFVPHGLFPQLVSRLIVRSPELDCVKGPKLYCNGAHFFLGKRSENDLILLCSKRAIRLVLKYYKNTSTDQQEATENSLTVKVRSLFEEELERLCEHWHWLGNVRYDVCVACLACKQSESVKCERHKSASCSDQDCLHLLPISSVEPNTLMTCPEQIGDHSRFTLTGLYKWYYSTTPEEKSPENSRKLVKVADIDILNLANDIPCHRWKVIGRLLHIEDARLNQIELNNSCDVYEQCYQMLSAWKSRQGSNATCEQLKEALSHTLVMRNDLVPKYCYTEK